MTRIRQPGRIVTALAVLALGACGGGNGSEVDTTSTTRAGVVTTDGADGAETTDLDGGSSTTVGGAAGTGSTTTAKGGGSGSATTAVATGKPAYEHSPAGAYKYQITGTASSPAFGTRDVDGPATLTVDAPTGTDQHARLAAEGTSTDQVLRFAPDGVRLVSIKTVQQGITKEFRPDPPAMVLPGGMKIGQSWSWSAKSTDGKTTVSASFRYDRNEKLTVEGQSLDTWVLEATVSTSGDVTSTSKQTIWYAQSLRLIAKQHDITSGTFGQVAFNSDTTRTLTDLP